MSIGSSGSASLVDDLGYRAVRIAESGRAPDALIRLGMNRVITSRLRDESNRAPGWRDSLRSDLWSGPIATNTTDANIQHYEVPGAFFEIVLGTRLKYSSGFWPAGITHLDAAEEAMLELSAERAGLSNGQRVLDLGCGWGSLTLWAARRYPRSEIVGISNSNGQRRYIERLARDAGLSNVRVVTADINNFEPQGVFDRIVSVEMLEHVRNHRAFFRRAHSWLSPDGAMFLHVFAHKEHEYPYEVSGPGSWMTELFFAGGLMPSPALVSDAADPFFHTEHTWWLNGLHYSRTLEAWLERMDDSRNLVGEVLEPVYGGDLELWIQRWRMFFMACSQMFKHRSGREWGISHHLLRPR